MFLRVVFLLAFPISRGLCIFDLAIVGPTVDVRFSNVVDFEPLATPARKATSGLNGGSRCRWTGHLRDLDNNCTDDKNTDKCDVHGVLVHRHVCQEYNLGENKT